jgi:hypothetical protein
MKANLSVTAVMMLSLVEAAAQQAAPPAAGGVGQPGAQRRLWRFTTRLNPARHRYPRVGTN